MAVDRFVAYLDDAAPSEAEVIVWREHLTTEDEVQLQPRCNNTLVSSLLVLQPL